MAERKAVLLRLDASLHAALQRWAADELRSFNGQVEFLLSRAVRESGRFRGPKPPKAPPPESEE